MALVPFKMRDIADKVLPPKGYFGPKICSEQGAGSQVICDQMGRDGKIYAQNAKKAAPKDRLNTLDFDQIRM